MKKIYLQIKLESISWICAVDHLVNSASLGHTFYFEEATDTNVFPILMVYIYGISSCFDHVHIHILYTISHLGHKLLG